ncbi:MAG: bifunctional UDP-N-acetylglucosamine diphosphorylase/glucosamine-1-phosphate N-acetyltransferase GlmU [Chloroflexi bacterium]|nr:bifunctional UDP-N-acetylglucosamine diphosphorylase/glucosamine-1-phosphate N-acetyltransferase GlmU [Chloroflexota bacterium]MDA1146482.1 bifunctional UDP-N-acetylglucosamine diphosphorylase/glucosamine-1-phosphate N-acetyltransferase GlmU [Chloroflexota bacterium]PKB56654.1 MAG: UDP-N-acetylglucosamine diphosphorylase/glucosamine-1-phosphate N-acetyltransferase [SAR202 cluster bacterium Casp-Chloro-G1]
MTETTGSAPLDGWTAVILAAGRGTRMRSALPKALHPVAGVPMVRLVSDAARAAGFRQIVVVVAPGGEAIAEAAGADATIAIQSEPLGTGHAALAGVNAAGEASHIAIVNADLPLLSADTFALTASRHAELGGPLTFLTAELDDPTGYGRVIRRDGLVDGIIEEIAADLTIRAIREVNAGLYMGQTAWLRAALEAIEPSPGGEFYLTDIVQMAVDSGGVETFRLRDLSEVQQVNDRLELARAEVVLRERVRRRLMLSGVTIVDPATTFIDANVEVGEDTTLLPGVHLQGATRLGQRCRIGPNAILSDIVAGDDVTIGGSTLEGSTLADGVQIGPYCHIRPGSTLERDVHLGNYVEVKASRIGAETRIGHFTYVGDADIGQAVNIGAGTVTANYDGTLKHRTEIGDGAFIGVDSMLIAPIVIGAGARTAAGAVVTSDVPAGATVIGMPARIRPE